jgi:hypothetical protein
MRFQGFTAASVKMKTFCNITPYLEADGFFGGIYCLQHQGDGASIVLMKCYYIIHLKGLRKLSEISSRKLI